MLTSEITISEPALPALNVRGVARRLAVPALLAAVAVAGLTILGGRIHVFADALQRGLSVRPGWVVVGVAFECISLAGYVALLSLVAGRATERIGIRESAQITFAGAAATRLLPTAGAGGAALALWALRRSGLKPVPRSADVARVPRVALLGLPRRDRAVRRGARARARARARTDGAERDPGGRRGDRDRTRARARSHSP